MQKPPYIKVLFPRGKRTLSTAVKRYFKNLGSKDLELDFGRERQRKTFVYTIIEASISDWSGWNTKGKIYQPKIVLQLKAEETE